MAVTIINKFGKLAGWNSIKSTMMGREPEGISEIQYGDNVDKENIYGVGKDPIGRGEGNYKANASVTLTIEEVNALQMSLPRGKRLSDITPFDWTVEYEYNGFKYKDRIRNCEFTGRSVEVKQGDKTIGSKFELIVSHIDWNV